MQQVRTELPQTHLPRSMQRHFRKCIRPSQAHDAVAHIKHPQITGGGNREKALTEWDRKVGNIITGTAKHPTRHLKSCPVPVKAPSDQHPRIAEQKSER